MDLDPAEIQNLLAVIAHPDHRQGLEEGRSFVFDRWQQRAAGLVRVFGTITGAADLSAWLIPNATVRLELPEPPGEFAGIEGAPTTTSRVYTVAALDPESRALEIDFVRHPEASPAMRWLDTVQRGDAVPMIGPRPHRVPGEGTPRILLADSSALPAALSIIRFQPSTAPTTVFAAVPKDELALFRTDAAAAARQTGSGPIEVIGVDPGGQTPLASRFAEVEVPSTVSVWASGEREDMRAIRERCRKQLALPAERAQIFGYWKRGTSNTRIDVARLRATHKALAAGRPFGETDDFEIGI